MNELTLDFITNDMFLSFLGCIVIVSIIVQFCKHLPTKDTINPLWFNLIASFVVSAIRFVLIKDYTLEACIMAILNSMVIYLGAIGGYETIKHISPIAKDNIEIAKELKKEKNKTKKKKEGK